MTETPTRQLDADHIEPGNLVDGAVSAITRLIREGQLEPGGKLPSEASLSKELRVSRTVVREAFRSLAAMRIIELNQGRRATIAHLDAGAMSLMFEHGIHTAQISIQQIYDVRRTIEMRTATLAALRRTEKEAQSILECASAMDKNFDNEESIMKFDIAFHLKIAHAAKNPIFSMIIDAFQGISRQTWLIGWRSRADDVQRHAMIGLHMELAEAIATGNPQSASLLMERHFNESTKALLMAGIS